MGKIVKYCAACDESFAEKFGFCPNCGQSMKAFEMSPLAGEIEAREEANLSALDNNRFEAKTPAPSFYETSTKSGNVSDGAVFSADTQEQEFSDGQIESNSEDIVNDAGIQPPEYTNTFAATAAADANGNGSGFKTTNYDYQPTGEKYIEQTNDDFHITVIEEKNVRQRNGLLLGATVLMLFLTIGGLIYSLFNHPLLVDAIGNDQLLAYVPAIDEAPMDVEETPKNNPDKGGGGGGGGRDEETPTSQGRLATQTEKPLIAPDKSIVQKDFELKQPVASTQGNKTIKPTDEPYGDPNSRFTLGSNGTGTGGGQGSGSGTGQGSGTGTGQGAGLGSGSGAGRGSGNGDGVGDGDNGRARTAPPPIVKKPEPVGVTEAIRFIVKPQAKYTDEARTNNIQGNVTLKITFLASGQVGSIAPVKGLPYGLTEKAIEAARQIKFEPQKKNGVPIPVTRTVSYSFTIY
ncbi:hypothetical protein BH18ACI1_BH18ACI1_04620 [soil metagenome]